MALDDQPRSVRDILIEMKDASEFTISLAYASLMFRDKELAEEVLGLESELDHLRHELFKRIIMAGRSPKEAEELAGILEIGVAADEISDAMGDLVKLVEKDYPVHPVISWMLYTAEERIGLIRVEKESPLISMTGKDLLDPSKLAGCEVLALKKRGKWYFDIPPDLEVEEGDLLLIEGTPESVQMARMLARGEEVLQPYPFERPVERLDEKAKEISMKLNSMKSLSELSIYLAYASILYNNASMAAEVAKLEEELDDMEEEVLKLAASLMKEMTPEEVLPLLRAASASERLGDAAIRMAQMVERGIPTHPILELVVEESEDVVVRVELHEESDAVGRTIRDIELEEKTGVWILAIKRGVRWIYNPKDEEILREGDILILSGPKEAMDDAINILGAKPIGD